MPDNNAVGSRVLLGSCFAVLLAFSGIASCGSGGSTVTSTPKSLPPLDFSATIASVQAAWAAEPYQTGTIHYYCDCGTGAEPGCVVGNNNNSGLTTALPRRTIQQAQTDFASLSAGDTIALCKGGAFGISSALTTFGSIGRCADTIACNDVREYTPTTFTGAAGSAKPIIYAASGIGSIFEFSGRGGVRILNLSLHGNGITTDIILTYNQAKDIIIANNDIDGATNAGVDMNPHPVPTPAWTASQLRMTVVGNNITNNTVHGMYGGANSYTFSYNNMLNNGNDNQFDHQIYLGNADSMELYDFQIVGNYIYGSSVPTCDGGIIIAHGNLTNILIANNWLEIPGAKTSNCYGISLNNYGGYPAPRHFRNVEISGNVIINSESRGITTAESPNAIIENNVIIYTSSSSEYYAIYAGEHARTTTADDLNTANVIRNNTVYFGPGVTGNAKYGVAVRIEGTGHIVSNNVVYSAATSGTQLDCFYYPLSLASYNFINNNQCDTAGAAYVWELTHGATLAAWQNYTSNYGFDANSISGSDPLFTNAPTDFKPAAGSPLIGAGNNISMSTLDKTGKARSNPPAIGAYEP
ncbi:MAG: hypothetical protein ACOY9D_04385 [Pseudomonadota bacterium]